MTTATFHAAALSTASCPALHTAAPAAQAVPLQDMLAHRAYLVSFAQRKLHDPSLAEDAVQDVFEAVISGRARFEGRAALRSWLTAILKNKIVDVIRQRARFDSLDASFGDDEDNAESDTLACPQAGPADIAEQRDLLRQTLSRIKGLPQGLRDVITMSVLGDQPSEQICRHLHISQASLFTRLHRARKQLMC